LIGVFLGNLGYSPTKGESVIEAVSQTLPYTLQLIFFSLIFTVIIGLVSGLLGARYVGKLPDKISRTLYIIGFASPPFFIALAVILFFTLVLPVLPTSGGVDVTVVLPPAVTHIPMLDAIIAGDWPAFDSLFSHAMLPALANALAVYGILTRILRSSLLDVMKSNFVTAARARAIPEGKIFFGYAFKNSLVTVITIISLLFTFILGSTIFVEYVFSYPGIGDYAVESALQIDYPSILAITLTFALLIIIANLLADVLYAVVDPRIRYR
jgi:peptide/nickel transport system permease protein